ncbi:hypothetical protein SAMN04488490_2689 [Marinobacter sp. LV10R510-11A]|nr:hypothetical protein SAMN04488490_2689 [Marinobacter sp. LV10R510-11A]
MDEILRWSGWCLQWSLVSSSERIMTRPPQPVMPVIHDSQHHAGNLGTGASSAYKEPVGMVMLGKDSNNR